MKNYAIINSSPHRRQGVEQLLEGLAQAGLSFQVIGRQPYDGRVWPSCRASKLLIMGPKTGSLVNMIIFIALLPLAWLSACLVCWSSRAEHKIDGVICLGLNEKVVITPVAKVFGIKTIWLEFPETEYGHIHPCLRRLYRMFSGYPDIITFGEHKKSQLAGIIGKEDIRVIEPGIRTNFHQHQDNIFNNIAKIEKGSFKKNYFTIGTVVDLNEKQNVEAIFQAISRSLEMAGNIQFIVVGDGEERKNLSWLAKKMKIDGLVWFVGEQKHLRKWLESFDVFIVGPIHPKLHDCNIVLEAMFSGLPVIGPKDSGLEDLVIENKNGVLVDMENSEMLSLQIIKLQQDKGLRDSLGAVGRARAEEYFNIERMINQFKEIL